MSDSISRPTVSRSSTYGRGSSGGGSGRRRHSSDSDNEQPRKIHRHDHHQRHKSRKIHNNNSSSSSSTKSGGTSSKFSKSDSSSSSSRSDKTTKGSGNEKYDPFAEIELDMPDLPKDDPSFIATENLLKDFDEDILLQMVMGGNTDLSAESLLQSLGSHTEQKSTGTSSSSGNNGNSKSETCSPLFTTTTINNISSVKVTTSVSIPKELQLQQQHDQQPQGINNLLTLLESDKFMEKIDLDEKLTDHLVKCQIVQKTSISYSNDSNNHYSEDSGSNHSFNGDKKIKPIEQTFTEYKGKNEDQNSNIGMKSGSKSKTNLILSDSTKPHHHHHYHYYNEASSRSRTPSNSSSRSNQSKSSRSRSRSKSPSHITPAVTTKIFNSHSRSRSKSPNQIPISKNRSKSKSKSPSHSKSPPSTTTTNSLPRASSINEGKGNNNRGRKSRSRSRSPASKCYSRSQPNFDRKRFKYRSSRSRSKSPLPSSSSSSSRLYSKPRRFHRSRSRSRSISPYKLSRSSFNLRNSHHNHNDTRKFVHHPHHPNGRFIGRSRSPGRIFRLGPSSPNDERTDRTSRYDRHNHRYDEHHQRRRRRSQDDIMRGEKRNSDIISLGDRDRAPTSNYANRHHHHGSSLRRSSEERSLRAKDSNEGYDGHRHYNYRDHKTYINGRNMADHFLPPNSNARHSDSTPLSQETSPQQLQLNVADSTISDSELAENSGQLSSFAFHNDTFELGEACQQDIINGFPSSSSSPKRLSLDERLEMEMGISLREETPYRSGYSYHHHMTGAYGGKRSDGKFPPLPSHDNTMWPQNGDPPNGIVFGQHSSAPPPPSQPRQVSQAIQNGDEIQVFPAEIPEKPFTVSKHNSKLNPIQVQSANYVVPPKDEKQQEIIKSVTIKLPVVPFKFYLPKPTESELVSQQYHIEQRAHSTKYPHRSRKKSSKKKKERVVAAKVEKEIPVEINNKEDDAKSSEPNEIETDDITIRPDDMNEADEQEEEASSTISVPVPDSPLRPVYTNKVPALPDVKPGKGILLVAGFSERIFNNKEKASKGVKFVDGIAPGYGTSRSEGEDMGCSPPPDQQNEQLTKKKNKERKKKLKSARRLEKEKLKRIKNANTENASSSPPPPPAVAYPYTPLHVLYQFNPPYAVVYAQAMAEYGFEVTFEPTTVVDDEPTCNADQLPNENDTSIASVTNLIDVLHGDDSRSSTVLEVNA